MSQTNYTLVSLPNEKRPANEVINANLFSSDKEFRSKRGHKSQLKLMYIPMYVCRLRTNVSILERPYGARLSETSVASR